MMEKKKVAVLAVNPVNGSGLFQYLEAFYENNISFNVYAVAPTTTIRTNSGISLCTGHVIADLKEHEDEYDALVFACGDAIPVFAQYATEPYNIALLEELKTFNDKGKIMIGHCAAALMFEKAGITQGKKLPYIRWPNRPYRKELPLTTSSKRMVTSTQHKMKTS